MTPELGIIEGFYGPPWSWHARARVAAFLAPYGYRFYLYAPKGDAYLRRQWQQLHPDHEREAMRTFANQCASHNVRFGVGLSPYELYKNFDDSARDALARKLAGFDDVGVRDLAILFDDMRGDMPDLAQRQVEIVAWIRERTRADRIIMCPTYYSNDPVLDRLFGARSDDYLQQLGEQLPQDVHAFWTGEEICARQLSTGDMRRAGELLRRKPFVWDNYPVNDTARMSRYLHLRAFTGRDAAIATYISAHGINPALQPTLSLIPALTLLESYRLGNDYRYGAAFDHAAAAVVGEELAAMLRQDLLWFQDVGLAGMNQERIAQLRERYHRLDHDAAREVVAFLDGQYAITDALIQAQ